MKYLKLFENFDDNDELDTLKYQKEYVAFLKWLNEKDFDFYDGAEEFEDMFFNVVNDESSTADQKAIEIAQHLDNRWGLYDGYSEVVNYLENLLK